MPKGPGDVATFAANKTMMLSGNERLEESLVTVVALAAASGFGKSVNETEPMPAYLN